MKKRAPRNRTLSCSEQEIARLSKSLKRITEPVSAEDVEGAVVNQDLFEAAVFLPRRFADLIVIDPPYNITKNFNGRLFTRKDRDEYCSWFESILDILTPLLKPQGTVYVCSDWKTSMLIAPILEDRLCVRNRITWEREKGRGAKTNWKNNTEDIWFCTASADYYFDVDAVKLKRKVIAPYRDRDGLPKDWDESEDGNYRLTHPSNIWSDITIPFWSMPENTDHPTQKPEKLIAKLILASTPRGAYVFDPFLGSGTTAVVSRKLDRRYLGVEQDTEYCCWALKRLEAAAQDRSIQGYADGVFWERNSLSNQKVGSEEPALVVDSESNLSLFK
jgi:site-specific DNA-methyltransferase (adenine-specific)